ncbi:MAG: hypothetical protein E7454_06585 [Ruminococcaceae bacterium]|nr:hypothetical protein [Oscillospiraceae bacterium]
MKKRIKIWPAQLLLYYVMLIILLTLLVAASYTWLTINQSLKVNDLSLYVTSQKGLEIASSPDGEWGIQLEYANLVDETAPLRPVTWLDQEQQFYAASYGPDGRHLGAWMDLSDDIHSNRNDVYGYYTKGVFYMRTDVEMTVSLAPAVATPEGASGTFLVGKPVWDSELLRHYNGGFGAENAIRIGLRITPLDGNGVLKTEEARFLILEPNANTHIDGSTGYQATPNFRDGGGLVPEDRLMIQNAASWQESDPVLRDHVVWSMGDFTTETELFRLKKNEVVCIEAYIWLEGQDVDCNNRIGQEAKILANLQFEGDAGNHPGLEPIE